MLTKKQLDLLEFICASPVTLQYRGDAEVCRKGSRFPDSRYLLAVFNLGQDPLDVLPLTTPTPITSAEVLAPDGAWQKICFAGHFLNTPLLAVEPKVFRILLESAFRNRCRRIAPANSPEPRKAKQA